MGNTVMSVGLKTSELFRSGTATVSFFDLHFAGRESEPDCQPS